MTPDTTMLCQDISRCRACHAGPDQLRSIFQMDPMPLAGQFCSTPAEAATIPAYPLTWVECGRCGLIQVQEDVADSDLFTRYNYASSTVAGLVRHFREFAATLAFRYAGRDRVALLEIGCNDGVLLNLLPNGWRLAGADPSDVAARAAGASARYELFNEPFGTELVKARGLGGAFDVVTGSNCLAHISDLKNVFDAVHRVLRPGGEFWVEVHDLDCLLAGAQWDTIYHEHKVEWSLPVLAGCLEAVGFDLIAAERLPLHGGLIRACFGKHSRPLLADRTAARTDPDRLADLRRAYIERYDTPAAREIRRLNEAGRRVAAYGASGRANVYLNQVPELQFAYIVDESPLRAGKFLPRVGTPVVPPAVLSDEPAAACLITAWNYRDDIIRKNSGHTGEWLTAFGQGA